MASETESAQTLHVFSGLPENKLLDEYMYGVVSLQMTKSENSSLLEVSDLWSPTNIVWVK